MTSMPDTTHTPLPPDDVDGSPGPAPDPVAPVGPMLYGRPLADVLGQVGRDSAYLFLTFPIALTSFVLLVTGVSLALGLVVIWVGVPVGAATLGMAVGFEKLERARLAARGTVLAPIVYAPVPGVGLRAQLQRLADPKRWAAVLHGILALVVSTFTWSVLVTWWAGIAGGLTYWFWERWLPEDNSGLADLLSLPVSDAQVNLVLGAVFALSLAPVLRWCVGLHELSARWLLTGSSRRALQAQVSDLTARRAAAAAAETASLRRLERDIHDGPQQRLVRLGMDLSTAQRRLDDDPAEGPGPRGALLACCHVQERPDGSCYVGMLAVRPDAQAHGLGRVMLGAAEARARAAGAHRLEMTVIAQRTDLIAWYERLGFADTGERSPFPYGDDRFGLPLRPDLEFRHLARPLGAGR